MGMPFLFYGLVGLAYFLIGLYREDIYDLGDVLLLMVESVFWPIYGFAALIAMVVVRR